MSDNHTPPSRSGFRRWLRRLLLAVLALLILSSVLLALLPRALSSRWARERIREEVSRAIHRSVAVRDLNLSWSGEIVLEDLRIADDPAFSESPILSLGRLGVHVDPTGLLGGRLILDLAVDELAIHLIRNQDGRTNLEGLLAEILPPGPTPPARAEPFEAPSFAIPFEDVQASIRLDNLSLSAEDRLDGSRAAIEKFSLKLDVPSLQEPASLEAGAFLRVDDEEPLPLRLGARVQRSAAPDGTVAPKALAVDVEATFPGCEVALHGDPQASRLRGDLSLDLAELMEAARVFLPPEIAETALAGGLTLRADLSGDPQGPLEFDVALSGSALAASGELLGGRALGPVDLEATHSGSVVPSERLVSVREGELRIQRGSRLVWRGSVRNPRGPKPEVSAVVGPVDLQLEELRHLAAPFLPAGLQLEFTGELRGDEPPLPSLTVERAEFSGRVPSGPSSGTVEGLGLSLPGLLVSSGENRVSGGALELGVERLQARLEDLFPVAASFEAALRVERLDVSGAQALSVQRLEVPQLHLELGALEKAPAGVLGITGWAEASESLAVGRLEVQGLARIDDVHQTLGARCELGEDDRFEIALRELAVSADSARSERPGAHSVHLHPDRDAPAVALGLGRLQLSGRLGPEGLPGGATPLELGDLSVSLPELLAEAGDRRVTAKGVQLSVPRLTSLLKNLFPERVQLGTSLEVAEVDLTGGPELHLESLELSAPKARLSELRPTDKALFGVAGAFELEQALSLEKLKVPALLEAAGVRQGLRIRGTLGSGRSGEAAVPRLEASAASVVVETPPGPIRAHGEVSGEVGRIVLRGQGREEIDLKGLRASFSLGPLLEGELEADARGLGARHLNTRGELRLDLRELARTLPERVLGPTKLIGTARLGWAAAGRVPTTPPLDLLSGVDFVDHLELSTALDAVGADVIVADGERLSIGGIFAKPPLKVVLSEGGKAIHVGGTILAEWIEALPYVGVFEEPLTAKVELEAEGDKTGSLRFSEALSLEPLGLEQEATIVASGVDRLLDRGLDTPLPLWLTLLGGEAGGSVRVGGAPDLGGLSEDLALGGPLEAALRVRVTRGEEVVASARFLAEEAHARFRNLVHVRGLDSDVLAEKRYRVVRRGPEEPKASAPSRLSEEVMKPGRSVTARFSGSEPKPVFRPFGSGSTLGFDLARVGLEPSPIELANFGMDLSFSEGLPSVDRVQADVLGGTLIGSLQVVRVASGQGGGFRLGARGSFTGLDAVRLAPRAATEPSPAAGQDTELSGQIALSVPIDTELQTLLAQLDLEAQVTHIGRRTLDRALYAMDPAESNETIVSQRRLLRIGSPRWVEVNVRNGNLSLAGQVQVGGALLDLPPIDRFNVADAPGLQRFEGTLARVGMIQEVLKALSAQALEIDEAGNIRFVGTEGKGVRGEEQASPERVTDH